MDSNPRVRAMIGYHLAYENCLVGMVMTQGRQREVINIDGRAVAAQHMHTGKNPAPVEVL